MQKDQIYYGWGIIVFLFITGSVFAQDKDPTKDMMLRLLEAKAIPDWKYVNNEFRKIYSNREADSLTASTKCSYYGAKQDRDKYSASLVSFGKNYGKSWTPEDLNSNAFMLFRYSNQADELQTALEWSRQSLADGQNENNPHFLDTYANLLYKLSRKEEALEYGSKALILFPDNRRYLDPKSGKLGYGLQKKRAMVTLFKMEKGEPTWPVEEGVEMYAKTLKEENEYWKLVRDKWLRKEYSSEEADSIMYLGKMYYYDETRNKPGYMNAFVDYTEKYNNSNTVQKNNNAWEIFTQSDSPEHLATALSWSSEAIKEIDQKDKNYNYYLDTYANLLYKLGDTLKAIEYIKKAQELSSERRKEALQITMDKMKKGEKTWE